MGTSGDDKRIEKSTSPTDSYLICATRRSWARAARDGVFVESAGEPPRPVADPEYDHDFIAALESLMIESDTGWGELFAELGLTPFVVYEELVNPLTYEATVCGVLNHIGVDFVGPVPKPRTWRQSDALNDEWVARFTADPDERTAADRSGGG